MLNILQKTLSIGIVTERFKVPKDEALEQLGIEIKRHIDQAFSGSIAIREVDAGSCNGCELEIHALNNPYYDIERFGIHFVASPRHADVLLVTGQFLGTCKPHYCEHLRPHLTQNGSLQWVIVPCAAESLGSHMPVAVRCPMCCQWMWLSLDARPRRWL